MALANRQLLNEMDAIGEWCGCALGSFVTNANIMKTGQQLQDMNEVFLVYWEPSEPKASQHALQTLDQTPNRVPHFDGRCSTNAIVYSADL